jgi:hypothetical protein
VKPKMEPTKKAFLFSTIIKNKKQTLNGVKIKLEKNE